MKAGKGPEPSRRPGGGWGDDEDVAPGKIIGNSLTQPTTFSANLTSNVTKQPQGITTPNTTTAAPSKYPPAPGTTLELFTWEALEAKNCEYEKKLVFDIIQPGGARVKQPDASLNEFCKAAESLSISLIGSLLITKLELDVVWIMKARALYAMESLSKVNEKYSQFFKKFINSIKNAPISGDGATQLTNVLNNVLKTLEGSGAGVDAPKQSSGLDFVPVQAPQTQPKTGGGASLLDMDDKPAQQQAAAPKKDAFGFMKPTESSPENKTGGFSFIKSGNQPSTPQQQQTQQPPAPKPANDLLGLDFSAPQSQPVQQQAPPQQQPPVQPKVGNSLLDMYSAAPQGGYGNPSPQNTNLFDLNMGGMPMGGPMMGQPPMGGPMPVQMGGPMPPQMGGFPVQMGVNVGPMGVVVGGPFPGGPMPVDNGQFFMGGPPQGGFVGYPPQGFPPQQPGFDQQFANMNLMGGGYPPQQQQQAPPVQQQPVNPNAGKPIDEREKAFDFLSM